MTKILFICLGNICRSPMAEYLMRNVAKKRGLTLQIDSAGTSGWHNGEKMHVGTAKILMDLGIDASDFRSSQVLDNAWDEYDYLIVMDQHNLADMEKRFFRQPEKLFVITDLLEEEIEGIPDPWYTGNFQEVCQLLTRACEVLADQLEKSSSFQAA